MIHTLFYVALWFLSLFIAWKLGAANEQIRVQRVLRSTLEGRELQTASGRARGASRPSSTEREPLAGGRPAALLAENDARVHSVDASSQSVLYDGEAEAARPLLSVVEGLEERPGLRVVEP